MHNVAHDIQVSACVLPACAVMNIITVPNTSLRIEAVGGTRQLVTVGQGFQPVLVRTTDTSLPRNPVKGVAVTFTSAVFRPDFDVFNEPSGELGGGTTTTPKSCIRAGISAAGYNRRQRSPGLKRQGRFCPSPQSQAAHAHRKSAADELRSLEDQGSRRLLARCVHLPLTFVSSNFGWQPDIQLED